MVFSRQISPRYGVFLVHGNASYTRCCNDAVHPLDGDVVGVTEVPRLRFFCAIWGVEAGGFSSKNSGLAL